MLSLSNLISVSEPVWPEVQQWIRSATNHITVLPCSPNEGGIALYHTQVSTRSPMGAVVYHTGGLLVEHGWLRILGAGSSRLRRSLPQWNKGKTFEEHGGQAGFLLIADDAIGGFFALNGGALGKDLGNVYYLGPDGIEWESLESSYADFLFFCFNGDMAAFYAGHFWPQWETEIPLLDGDAVYSFNPPLFIDPGMPLQERSRKIIPVEEQYNQVMRMLQQPGDLN